MKRRDEDMLASCVLREKQQRCLERAQPLGEAVTAKVCQAYRSLYI